MPVMDSPTLSTPLSSIHGIGPRFLQRFKKLGIFTVRDLLWHLPKRYEDFSSITEITNLSPREECTVEGTVKKISMRRAWHKRMFITESVIEDESGEIRVVWFNQTYIKNILQEGTRVNISGKVSVSKDGELYFSNPTYEIPSKYGKETKHTGRVVAIYPETKGLTSKGFRYIIQPLLEAMPSIPETLPDEVVTLNDLMPLDTALRTIHLPPSIDAGLEAKKRFAFEDLFLLQLFLLGERMRTKKQKAHALEIEIPMIKAFVDTLPFELTPSQKQSLWETVKDMNNPHPMNRLLQGDVGSGKTIVAALAAVFAAHKGYQTAFMAPTEILARQHYETMKKFFPDHEEGIALLTGSESKVSYGHGLETKMKKAALVREIERERVKIVIGTHALLSRADARGAIDVAFPSLALVIIDEQHRFGVRQRAKLVTTKEKYAPHLLSMSATPIPRTLSLALWSDLDLSLITELPKNRKPILTKVIPPDDREKAYTFIRGEIKKGRQAFVVCPRIEPATQDDALTAKELQELAVKSVKEEHEKLSKKIFPDLRVAMIHGKLSATEKERVMREFSENKIHILISTAVIEVGVDIPNATIMMIEGAERFGLAQLYQFKGRVGRGSNQSYCMLFSDSSSGDTKKRLLSIVEAKNGFELAEKDLALRGPGQFLGNEQTGIPDLAMNALQHPLLMKQARKVAKQIIQSDMELAAHPKLKERMRVFAERIHRE